MALEFEMKVGDRVMIKPNLSVDDSYPCGVADEMVELAGQVMTVREIISVENNCQVVRLEEDDYGFAWSTPMFEGLAGGFYHLRTEYNLVELRDGRLMLKYKNSIMTPNGFAIGISNYDGAKHKSKRELDIVKVYEPKSENYRFEKGECIWQEETEEV
jgi:hypothetical protein